MDGTQPASEGPLVGRPNLFWLVVIQTPTMGPSTGLPGWKSPRGQGTNAGKGPGGTDLKVLGVIRSAFAKATGSIEYLGLGPREGKVYSWDAASPDSVVEVFSRKHAFEQPRGGGYIERDGYAIRPIPKEERLVWGAFPGRRIEKLGAGSYGTVFSLGDDRAVKVIPFAEWHEPWPILHELTMATHMSKTQVGPTIYSTRFVTDGEGGEYALLEMARARGDIDEKVLTHESKFQLHALVGRMWGHHAFHADIKPANILDFPSEGGLRIADFGLSRFDPSSEDRYHEVARPIIQQFIDAFRSDQSEADIWARILACNQARLVEYAKGPLDNVDYYAPGFRPKLTERFLSERGDRASIDWVTHSHGPVCKACRQSSTWRSEPTGTGTTASSGSTPPGHTPQPSKRKRTDSDSSSSQGAKRPRHAQPQPPSSVTRRGQPVHHGATEEGACSLL
jgi:hypothetical protein